MSWKKGVDGKRYLNDPDYKAQVLERRRAEYKTRYHGDPVFREANLSRVRRIYATDGLFRSAALARSRKQRLEKPEQVAAYKSRWHKRRLEIDHLYRLSRALRKRVWMAFHKRAWTKRSSVSSLLGTDFQTVKSHLELQFLPGMSWRNHGAWHIDHRVPLASAKTEGELKKLFHYTNLQPLWAGDNIRKHSKCPE